MGIPTNKTTSAPWALATLVIVAGMSNPASAAPGNLSQSPLFLTTGVQPNIAFLIDDSGSMNWEITVSEGGRADSNYCDPNQNSGCRVLDFTPNNTTERLELCRGYNVMAYDPSATYTPWSGVDDDGNPYTDQTLRYARDNPFETDTSDIRNHFYFPWNDADGDNQYDAGECPTPAVTTASDCAGSSSCVRVSALPAAQQTNYANWYSYYRKREYVAKRALSEIIEQSTARVGMATLHNNENVGTLVKDIDDISTPVDATARANKIALMRNLFRNEPGGGTPLRSKLNHLGKYFKGTATAAEDLFGTGSAPPSPILPEAEGGACQQNFGIVMSDGYWNGGNPGVGDTDGDGNSAWDGGSYADNFSNTLADVAMKYYEEDLSSLPNKVPVIAGVDTNTQQHMVTYTVAFGVNGTLSSDPPNTTSAFGWPEPIANQPTTIDDMRHAAWNGRGKFLNAGDPQTLVSSLNAAIADISSRTGSAAAVSFNSTSLQSNSLVYQAKFNSADWSGDLLAFNISTAGIGPLAWSAGALLDARDLATDPRTIVTFNGTNGIQFDWPADYTSPSATELTSAQIGDLLTNAPYPANTTNASEVAANQAFGDSIVAFLRGDHSNEGSSASNFRDRQGHRLGDLVHSSPVFVGVPNTRYPDTIEGLANRYSAFASANSTRAGMVYVGSNDGMLHAFRSDGSADAGKEVFAYIPSSLFSSNSGEGLHYLADQNYIHRYYVDLSAAAADVFVGGSWKTMLIGGLRGGGKGLFALDITDPDVFTSNPTSVPQWEFTHNDLGYTFSDVRVGRLNNGKWAAIFGNGYNNDPSGDGRAKLFIVYLDGSNLSSPILLDTKAGSVSGGSCSNSASDCNGMSTPEIVDLNGDGNIDRVFAGDLQGNMWAFDIRDANPNNWGPAYGTAATPQPLFTACTSSTCTSGGKAVNRQPITAKPTVARHPTQRAVATAPNLMVFFGTGQYMATNDNSTADTQSFYGVWDRGAGSLGRSDLQAQTITLTSHSSGVPARLVSSNPVNYDPSSPSGEDGWRIDLPTSRERVVASPVAVGELVFFNTMIPSGDICGFGGSGWLMTVNQLDGGEPDFPPVDVNNDGVFDASDKISGASIAGLEVTGLPTESRFISNKQITTDSTGTLSVQSIQAVPPRPPSRMSWTVLEN